MHVYMYTFIHIIRSAGGTYRLPYWLLRAVLAAISASEDGLSERAEEKEDASLR